MDVYGNLDQNKGSDQTQQMFTPGVQGNNKVFWYDVLTNFIFTAN